MAKIIFICILSSITLGSAAQQRFTISGHVKDASTGEPLIGVTVIVLDLEATGTETNEYGINAIT